MVLIADTKITALAALTGANVASGDELVIVDVSDTTMAASGTDKNITAAELATAMKTLGPLIPAGGAHGAVLKTGMIYFPSNYISGSNATPVLSEMRAAPLFLAKAGTVDRIGWRNSTIVASALIRLGIYNDDGTGYPGALLLDAGTADLSATAGVNLITISQALSAGQYWLVAVPQGAVANGQMMASGLTVNPLETTAWGATDISLGWAQSSVTGALPSNFTTTKTRTPSPFVVAVRSA